MIRGETVQTTCKDSACGQHFSYVSVGYKPRSFCPACIIRHRKAANSRASKQTLKGLKNKAGEDFSMRKFRSPGSAVVMPHSEAVRRLALWEGMERLLATGDTGIMKPISRNAARELERKALKKIRKAVGPFFDAYKKERRDEEPNGPIPRHRHGESLNWQVLVPTRIK